MDLFLNLGVAVVALFSVCLGWYLAQYRLAVAGAVKGITFVAFTAGIFMVTMAAAIFVVWPPFLPL